MCVLCVCAPHTQVDQVLEAMRDSGLPFTTRTAYVAIRGAVNAGRQEAAEAYANMFTVRVCVYVCIVEGQQPQPGVRL